MPKSALMVAKALERGPLTREQVRLRTGLPDRTLRFAVGRLREARLIEERRSLKDARMKLFFLAADEDHEGEGGKVSHTPS